jgi:hypothetical protein
MTLLRNLYHLLVVLFLGIAIFGASATRSIAQDVPDDEKICEEVAVSQFGGNAKNDYSAAQSYQQPNAPEAQGDGPILTFGRCANRCWAKYGTWGGICPYIGLGQSYIH